MKSKQIIMCVKDITLKLTRFFAGNLAAADVDGRVKSSSSSSSSSSSGSTSLSLVCNKRNNLNLILSYPVLRRSFHCIKKLYSSISLRNCMINYTNLGLNCTVLMIFSTLLFVNRMASCYYNVGQI